MHRKTRSSLDLMIFSSIVRVQIIPHIEMKTMNMNSRHNIDGIMKLNANKCKQLTSIYNLKREKLQQGQMYILNIQFCVE